jgi:ferredoxin-type protein NapF
MEIKDSGPEPPRLGCARLDTTLCLAWNGVICMSCQYPRSFRAISLDRRGRPALAAPACTGCGQCVAVCPEGAITLVAASDG